MTAPCPGAAALRGRWAARSLAGAFLDLALAWACLCLAAAARVLALPGLPLPCTCARPHLPCLLAFLARYPPRALASVHAALRARFPFAGPADDGDEEPAQPAADAESADPGAPREEARAELQRELEKERSAAASGAEEAMAMILRLQKEKSALEIEARQQRCTADERCAFYEDEVEELREIVLVRDREARALRKEVDAYRRFLGLGPAEDGEETGHAPPPGGRRRRRGDRAARSARGLRRRGARPPRRGAAALPPPRPRTSPWEEGAGEQGPTALAGAAAMLRPLLPPRLRARAAQRWGSGGSRRRRM